MHLNQLTQSTLHSQCQWRQCKELDSHGWKSHREEFRVQYLHQGHCDTQTGGAGDQTSTSDKCMTRSPHEPQLNKTTAF